MHTYGANRWKTLDRYFLYPQSESRVKTVGEETIEKKKNGILFCTYPFC